MTFDTEQRAEAVIGIKPDTTHNKSPKAAWRSELGVAKFLAAHGQFDSQIMTRIQLDMNDELVKELDELVKETNLATRKELFNNALTIFQWAVRSRKAGLIVAALNEEKGVAKELVMPALEAVKPINDRKTVLSK